MSHPSQNPKHFPLGRYTIEHWEITKSQAFSSRKQTHEESGVTNVPTITKAQAKERYRSGLQID